ncbi:tRNA lysidine(34) synthetase TilS [Glycocaulis sp.]|uniref:tRNA lysidine(34) synthetase TilS n=1 Tax=Glycocaulis sp. TaxID=1969725 RepID=UPI003D1FE482
MPLEPDLTGGARAVSRLCPAGPLVLALSGGGDSMALACLMAGEAARSGRELHTLIVDHRLRPESADEAALVAQRAEALGAKAYILVWNAPAPGQGAARRARHGLLADAARQLGASSLFLAHTADDVIETLLMRLSRPAAGWRALAAMGESGPSPAWPQGRGIRLARPLVRASRAALRDYLKREGVDWVDDPSNANRAFERVRIRAAAPLPASQAGRRLLALNDAALAADRASRRAARQLLAAIADILPWGGAALDGALLAAAPREAGLRACEALILAVSGEQAMPGPDNVTGLLDALQAGRAFSGAGVLLTREGVIGRDPGAVAGRADGRRGVDALHVKPGDCGVFDGRMLVCAGSAPLTVKPLLERNRVVEGVPARLRPSLAVIESEGRSVITGLETPPGDGAAGALIADRLEGLLGVSANGTAGENSV